MFFVLSKVLTWLIMPLSIIIFCFLLAFVLKAEKLKKLAVRVGVGLLIFFTNPFIGNFCLGLWEIAPIEYKSIRDYEVGIVLSGVTSQRKSPKDRVHFNQGADRILHAIELYKLGKIKKILITGGSGSITRPMNKESADLKKVSVLFGVNPKDIILEDKARNTYENALLSKTIIDSLEVNDAILITSAFHMRRAKACFDKQGINVLSFSTDPSIQRIRYTPENLIIPSSATLLIWNTLFKEWVGMISYKVMCYI